MTDYDRTPRTAEIRHDLRVACSSCGHHEFVVLVRAYRDARGTKTDVDVEACERCDRVRHT